MRKPPGEQTLQNHYTLLLDGPAKGDVPFDIDDKMSTDRSFGSNAGPRTKGVVAKIAWYQRIDLSDSVSRRLDHDRAVGDGLLHTVFDPTVSSPALGQRILNGSLYAVSLRRVQQCGQPATISSINSKRAVSLRQLAAVRAANPSSVQALRHY